MSTSAAVSVVPTPRLQLSLRTDGRYDHHPDDGYGEDSGITLAPTLAARWIIPVSSSLAFGVEAGIWFPGTESLSPALRASSPHAQFFGTTRAGPLAFTALCGYRLDRSRAASPELDGMRAGDRLALGLSDFDAALAAVGVAYLLGPSRLFAEFSGDFLLGSDAPPVSESPLTAAAGARYQANDAWTLELLLSVSPSKRPALAATDPLIPIEPRAAALAGVRVHWPTTETPSSLQPRADARQEPTAAALASIQLSVQLPAAKASTVTATLSREGRDYPLRSQGNNQFELRDISPGSAVLRVSAAGYRDSIQNIEVPKSGVQRLEVQLQLALRAQIRGLVRSFQGKGLPAQIRIDPLGIVATSDADGFFELDVPPGTYSVTVEAAGYRAQRREVVIQPDGVVVLNADLLRAP